MIGGSSFPLPPAERAPTGSWRRALLAAFGLAALTVLLYWPAVDFRLLVFDDHNYTIGNGFITRGLDGENIVRAFLEPSANLLYIPLTQLSLMADVELFGMSPRGFHLTNILLHAADMALLLLLLWRMTGSLGLSTLAAAFVAFHPMRVESVAWVAERKDVLSVFFLLLSMACYLRYARRPKWGWYGAVIFCFLFGMLAKPMVVTLPLLLLLLDFWPLGRFRREPGEIGLRLAGRRLLTLVAEKIPLLALSAFISLVTVQLQQKAALHTGVSVASRLEHSFAADFIYLFQTIWPRELVFQFFPTIWDRASGTLIPSAAGLAAVTALVVRYAGTRPYLAFGWFWYLVSLFPVSGIVPTGVQWISDRFTYVSHIGLAVGFVWLVGGIPPRRSRPVLLALAALLLVPLVIISRRQLFVWKDGATLFARSIAHFPENAKYRDHYVRELINLGDFARAREQAEQLLPNAMEPEFGIDIQKNYLTILEGMGDRKGAIEQARRFLREDPRFWRTRLRLADYLLAEEHFSDAAKEYRLVLESREALSWPVDRGHALEGLGISLSRMGNDVEALASYSEGLQANPASISLRQNLALLLAHQGRPQEALAYYAEALRIAPEDLTIRMALAELLLKTGAVQAAAIQFQEVAQRAPGKAESLYARGRILEAAGMHPQARSVYESALKAPALLPETIDAVQMRLTRIKSP